MAMREDSERMVRNLAHDELSVKSRLGYVVLLLAAAAMTVIILTLWLTEPGVPARAQIAFGVMSLIGVSWIGLATWVLTTHRVLAARDRVIAGWMAVAFTSVYLLVTIFAAVLSHKIQGLYGVAGGVLMVMLALKMLKKARRRYHELAARRAELERQLAA